MSLPRFHKKSFDSDFEVTEKVLEKSSIYNKFPLVYSDSRSEYEEFYEAILKLNILTPLEDCKIMQANNFLQEISMVLKKYGVRDLIKVHSISIRDLIENKYIATISDENQSFAQEICLDIVDSLYETTDFQAYFSGNSGNSVDFVDFPLEILIIPESFSTFFEKSASQRQLKVMKLLRIWKKNKSDISNNILDYIVLNNTHELYTLSSAFRTCLEAISGGILLNLYQSYGFLNIETVIMAQHLAQDTLFLLSQGEVIKIFE